MKKFNQFVNESVQNNDYEDFLETVKNSIINDFDMSEQQTTIFIKKNDDKLQQLFDDGVEPKDAIAIIKLP